MREFRIYGDRPQWDVSLVAKVEELIDITIGEQDKNVVDFKMLQTVLYILARHLRILEQMVEVRTHHGEQAKEDSDKDESKQKFKEKGLTSSDGYLSSDESEGSDDDGKAKKEGKDKSSTDEEYITKKSRSRDKESTQDDRKERKEKSIKSESKVRRERSEDWFSDDEREESDSYKKEKTGRQKERGKDREEVSAKHDKEKTSHKKDRGNNPGDKDRRREKDDEDGRHGKVKARDDKSGGRASDESEIIHKGVIDKGGHKRKPQESDKNGKKSKHRDSREEREFERVVSEEREVRGKKEKAGHHYVGSIEVVTQQQFRALERVVNELQARATVPAPHMPDNKKLMSEIAQGSASLTDVMSAMQLNARILATERAIERMAQLVSLLAASGDLPAEVLSTFTELEAEVANMAAQSMGISKSPRDQGRKSLGLGKLSTLSTLSTAEAEASAAMKRGILGTSGHIGSERKEGMETEGELIEEKEAKKGKKRGPAQEKRQQTHGIEYVEQTQGAEVGGALLIPEHDEDVMEKEPSAEMSQILASASTTFVRSIPSKRSIGSTGCVTVQEMNEALRALREDLMKNVGNITARANASAEAAIGIAKDVGSKLARAMKLNERVSMLYGMVNDYTDQLHGFDTSIHSQMQSFQQQLNSIKRDLYEGLHELHNITNNAETGAVLELKEQYQMVATELDETLNSHKKLLSNQGFLTMQIKEIAECIEEMRDQKADRDEVIDGLRDKADLNRLAGLLTLEDFTRLYDELELRIQMCYDKFRSQDAVWMRVVQEFNEVISAKVELAQMRAMQDEAQERFQQLNMKALMLKRVLGDPKAAVLTRKLTKGAICATCAQAAMMDVSDAGAAAPPRLPAFRPRPPGADDVCLRGGPLPKLDPYEDETRRPHICKRWCGGSHTLISSAVTRQDASHFTAGDTRSSRRYMGLGTDNKLYMLDEPCQPCEECNFVKIPGETEEPSPHPGAGDQGDGPTIVTGMEAHRVTIVADADIQLMRDELARKRRSLERRRSSGGSLRSLDRETGQEMDSRGGCEGMVPTKPCDTGVTMKGHIKILAEEGSALQGRALRSRRSSLTQDRIREQFEAAVPNASATDFISEAIAALSEL